MEIKERVWSTSLKLLLKTEKNRDRNVTTENFDYDGSAKIKSWTVNEEKSSWTQGNECRTKSKETSWTNG